MDQFAPIRKHDNPALVAEFNHLYTLVNALFARGSGAAGYGITEFVTTAGQTDFPLTFEYKLGAKELIFIVGGSVTDSSFFTESTPRLVTISPALPLGTRVMVIKR